VATVGWLLCWSSQVTWSRATVGEGVVWERSIDLTAHKLEEGQVGGGL
jgi:hypothetical protein